MFNISNNRRIHHPPTLKLRGGRTLLGYIDEDVYKIGETYKSLIKEFEGVCTWGPFISLNRGIYDVTITYYSDTNDNSFQLFSKSANFLSDEINFEKNKNSLETRIWSN